MANMLKVWGPEFNLSKPVGNDDTYVITGDIHGHADYIYATDVEIENEFNCNPNFTIDNSPSAVESMNKSKIMISDLSGVIWDYLLLFKKPTLLMNTPKEIAGSETTDLPFESWEKGLIVNLFDTFTQDEINDIPTKIESLGATTLEIEAKDLFNRGSASVVAAQELITIKRELNV